MEIKRKETEKGAQYLFKKSNFFDTAKDSIILVDKAKLHLWNQKNDRQNGVIHHEMVVSAIDVNYLVRALARRAVYVLYYGGTCSTLLNDSFDKFQWRQVTANNTVTTVKVSVIVTGLEKQGIIQDDVDLHWLGVGGDMALRLNTSSDTVIKMIGT